MKRISSVIIILWLLLLVFGCDDSGSKPTQPAINTIAKDTSLKAADSVKSNISKFQLIINSEIPNSKTITKVEFVWAGNDSIAHVVKLSESTSRTTYSTVASIDSVECYSNNCLGFVRLYDSTSSYYTQPSYFNQKTGILSYTFQQFIANTQFNTSGLSLVPNDSSVEKWAKEYTKVYVLDTNEVYDTLLTDTIDYTIGNDFYSMKGGKVDNVTPLYSKSFDSLTTLYGYCFRDSLNSSIHKPYINPHVDSMLKYMQVYLEPYSNPGFIFIPILIRYNIDKGCFHRSASSYPTSTIDTIVLYRSIHQVITEFTAKQYLNNAPTDNITVGRNRIVSNIQRVNWEIGTNPTQNALGRFFYNRHLTDFKATYVYRTRKIFYTRIK